LLVPKILTVEKNHSVEAQKTIPSGCLFRRHKLNSASPLQANLRCFWPPPLSPPIDSQIPAISSADVSAAKVNLLFLSSARLSQPNIDDAYPNSPANPLHDRFDAVVANSC
jgi:hypothetical protein